MRPIRDESQLEMSIHDRRVHPLPSLHDLPENQIRQVLFDSSYRRFCIVRNPYARLVSAWVDKIRQVEPAFELICCEILRHARNAERHAVPTFREFVSWVVETNDPNSCDIHWRPQQNLLYPDLINYGFVLKFEDLYNDLQRFFDSDSSTRGLNAKQLISSNRYNGSLPANLSGLYDPSLVEQVSKFWASDFSVFDYDATSWLEFRAKVGPNYTELESSALSAIRARNAVIRQMGLTRG